MKKTVSVIFVLVLALGMMLSLVSCNDGKLTKKEWEAAFDFENVTIELVEGETKSDAEVMGEIYVVDGDWYMVEEGIVINFTETGLDSVFKPMIDFSDDYDDFEYKDGKYTCAEKEISVIGTGKTKITDIVVKFDGKKVKELSFKTEEDGESSYTGCNFKDYGTTEVPESEALPDSETTATYTNEYVTFEYPDNFTEDYEDSYSNSVASNFQLLTLEDVGVYGNLDNDKYEELFIPEYEDLGLTVTDWNVVRKNNGELNVLVITQLASVAGIQFNQALLVVDVGDTIVQITCTVYEGSSDGFIDVIFESLRLAD